MEGVYDDENEIGKVAPEDQEFPSPRNSAAHSGVVRALRGSNAVKCGVSRVFRGPIHLVHIDL